MKPAIPALSVCRSTARVCINRKWIYLGNAGTQDALDRYDQVVAEYLANGRRLPGGITSPLTVGMLADRYFVFAQDYYRKGDKPTDSVLVVRRALELLVAVDDALLAQDYGPLLLRAFQRRLAAMPGQQLSRGSINRYVDVVRGMFRWAGEEELLAHGRWSDLDTVRPLQKGRSPAAGIPAPREGKTVRPVAQNILEGTIAAAHSLLRAMIELQLATAMRPGELVAIRGRYLQPSLREDVWIYTVPDEINKSAHHEKVRKVLLGPRAITILKPWLYPDHPDAPVFSPARTMQLQVEARAAARQTPLYGRSGERRRGINLDRWQPQYDVDAYRHAIIKTCDRAFPHPVISAIPPRRRTAAQANELEAWRRLHRWHPHQLRHNAASYLAENESLQIAQAILGHQSIVTTMRYIRVPDQQVLHASVRRG